MVPLCSRIPLVQRGVSVGRLRGVRSALRALPQAVELLAQARHLGLRLLLTGRPESSASSIVSKTEPSTRVRHHQPGAELFGLCRAATGIYTSKGALGIAPPDLQRMRSALRVGPS